MKTYQGHRDAQGTLTVTVDGQPLSPRYDLANHSPDGFECGYAGSGPAQLALAMCADLLKDDQRALRCYQMVKWTLVASLRRNVDWEITEQELLNAVNNAESTTP